MLCARCKKFLIFLFKHLTKRASSAQTPRAQVLKKKNKEKRKRWKMRIPIFPFGLKLITLAWKNIIRIKQHTMQSAWRRLHFSQHPRHPRSPPPPHPHHRFSTAIFIHRLPPGMLDDVGRFIFLLMKQLLPGGIMTIIIIIIMRRAKVAVKASCKIIFRWQLSEAAFHFSRAKSVSVSARPKSLWPGLIKFSDGKPKNPSRQRLKTAKNRLDSVKLTLFRLKINWVLVDWKYPS